MGETTAPNIQRDIVTRLEHSEQMQGDGLIDLQQDAIAEIKVLRQIVATLGPKFTHPKNWAWMEGSPADIAYERALESGRSDTDG